MFSGLTGGTLGSFFSEQLKGSTCESYLASQSHMNFAKVILRRQGNRSIFQEVKVILHRQGFSKSRTYLGIKFRLNILIIVNFTSSPLQLSVVWLQAAILVISI